ncbi:hypothetical protein GCM10009830_09100 [Glycomyces endophyticus]|uniref:Glycosyl hydrolases family 39 N-terminal catalytic domain-containing protein n=1 Tax=Glycomyces endophyticus TaxID=480996 RepID=A0ABN2G6R3_9ACTN
MNSNRLRHPAAVSGTAVLLAGALLWLAPAAGAEEPVISVDFTTPTAVIEPGDIGASITGYGGLNYIVDSAAHRAAMAAHDFGALRIELEYATPGDHTSRIVCGGDYCHTAFDGDQWIDAIRSLDAEPVLVVPAEPGDALALFAHFHDQAPITKVVVGNELDAGDPPRMDAAAYSAAFNEIAAGIHAVDPSVEVGGPGTAHDNIGYLTTFLAGSGQHVDFVDYHDYGKGPEAKPAAQLLAEAADYAVDIAAVRDLIDTTVPARAAEIGIQIGEWNMDWADPSPACASMTTHLPAVWGAAVLGTILEADATALVYGDKNGCLGLTGEWGEGTGGDHVGINEPLPIAHGIGMFTGEGLFRHFGTTMVATASPDPLLYVFASTGEKNVVIVNTGTAAVTTGVDFTGLTAGTAAIWRTTDADRTPHQDGTAAITAGATTIDLPARSVTTLVIG